MTTHADPDLTANTYTYRVIATGTPDSAPSNEVVVIIGNPVADAYVREGTNAGNNYGTETFVKVKLNTTVNNNRRGYRPLLAGRRGGERHLGQAAPLRRRRHQHEERRRARGRRTSPGARPPSPSATRRR